MSNEVLGLPLTGANQLPAQAQTGDAAVWDGDSWAAGAAGGRAYKITYVNPSGSDTTGRPNDASKPFATLAAAVAAVNTDEESDVMIWVGPGDYTNSSNLAVQGIRWFFQRGASVTQTDNTAFDSRNFGEDDLYVGGHGVFYTQGEAALVNHSGTSLFFEFDRISTNSDQDIIRASCEQNSSINIRGTVLLVNHQNGGCGIELNSPFKARINVDFIQAENARCIIVNGDLGDSVLVTGVEFTSNTSAVRASQGVFKIANIRGDPTFDDGYGFSATSENQTVGKIIIEGTVDSLSDGAPADITLLGWCDTAFVYNAETCLRSGVYRVINIYGGIVRDVSMGGRSTERTRLSVWDGNVSAKAAGLDGIVQVQVYGGKLQYTGDGRTQVNNVQADIEEDVRLQNEPVVVYGGDLTLHGDFSIGECRQFLRVAGGITRLLNCSIATEGTNSAVMNIPVIYDTGTLQINGAVINSKRANVRPIYNSTPETVMILPGGLTTNYNSEDLFTEHPLVYKMKILASGAAVHLTIDLGAETTFTINETDAVTWPTAVAMAAHVKELFDLSGLFIASQYDADTDYFYITHTALLFSEVLNIDPTGYTPNNSGLDIVGGGPVAYIHDLV